MKRNIQSLLAVLALLTAPLSMAQNAGEPQDLDELRTTVEQFLKTQAAGLPGKVNVVVNQVDPRTSLAVCTSPEPFLPTGSRAWGKTSVGVRCTAPTKWTIYLKARVKVTGEYLATTLPLAQGHVITAKDVVKMQGDLASMPPGVITDPGQAIGQKVSMSIALGAPIIKDLLRSQQVIQSGQTVRLLSLGSGFRITTEGRALGSANEGQIIQTRTSSGQTVSGIARMGGIVEVTF
jgi:flagellar basal body P-ring formation protein FlgA